MATELLKVLDEFSPDWFLKLPTEIKFVILFALVFHIIGLGILVFLGLYEPKNSKPDFKSKLT